MERRAFMDFESIFDQYFNKIYKFIRIKTLNSMYSEDIASIVFEKVNRNIESFDPNKSSFETWLYTIARNEISSFYRKKEVATVGLDHAYNIYDEANTPDRQIEDSSYSSDLQDALASLNENERTIIAYKYGLDLKNTEIADLMGISNSNVGVVLFRILKKLKKKMEV